MKKLLTLLILLTLFSTSCSKNDDPQPQSINSIPKVKTIAYGSTNASTFTYDYQGRILKQGESDGSKVEYIYNANSVIENSFNSALTLTKTYSIELNTNGLIENATLIFPYNIDHRLEYTYNTDKQLAVLKSTSGTNFNLNYNEEYKYTSKQLNNKKRYQLDGTLFQTTNYEYFTDENNSIGFKNRGLNYYADVSEFPIKSEMIIFSATNSNTYFYDYNYDSKNRISKKIINSGNDGINDITYY